MASITTSLPNTTPPKTSHCEHTELTQEELSSVEGTRTIASLEYVLDALRLLPGLLPLAGFSNPLACRALYLIEHLAR